MKEGDRVVLINEKELTKVTMGSYLGKIAILQGRLSQQEIHARPTLDVFGIAWWIRLEKDIKDPYASRYFVPECCFIRAEPKTEVKTRKEQTDMALFAITVLKTPSVKAQEAGEVETIVVPGTEVVAYDTSAAICLIGAEHADAIKALEGAKIRVIARNLG